jgi:sensor histidine kinase YesM
MKKLMSSEAVISIVIWLVLGVFMYEQTIANVPYENKLLSFLAVILPLIPPVYIHFWLVDKFLLHKKYVPYGIFTLLVLVAFGYLTSFLGDAFVSITYPKIIDGAELTVSKVYHPYFAPAAFTLLFSAIKFTIAGMQQKMLVKELEAEKAKAEFSALKAQVNPHFLFNTLNTLFSMASLNKDDQTAEGIAKLSHLMRYMIYDSKADRIELKREIEHIDNFIEIYKLRFEESVENDLIFEIKTETENIMVPPLLFLPVIENAFKHGHSVHAGFLLHILFYRVENRLCFEVENSINTNKKKDGASGFGLKNLKKSLDLLYANNYKLAISEGDNIFTVKLEIPV